MNGFDFPDISPVMFTLGPVAVRWYSMAYLLGIIFGWVMLKCNVKKNNLALSETNIEDLIFYVTLGIILGGRLGYVLFYGQDVYWHNPLQIFAIWHGGMSFHGGIIGVILAIWYFARKIHYPFLGLTDLVVLYAPIGIFLGRLANFVNDELWGRPTDVAWAVKFPSGGYIPRHPSQIYEALTEGVLMFLVLNFLWRYKAVREKVGVTSALFAILYATFRMSMEQFRQPDAQLGFFFGSITMGQMLSCPLLIAGLWVLWVKVFKPWMSRSA